MSPAPRSPLALVRRAADPRVWGRWWARIVGHRAIHQDTTLTWRDRYPALFAAARDLLGAQGAHRILSFGCAAGEEVLTLREYFPQARIVGAEINRAELAACRRLAVDDDITFIHSTRATIDTQGPYDAIFCMAVLQRRPDAVARAGTTDIAALYPFARFADEIAFLVRQLRPGGLLVVEHCQYRVEDTPAAASLVPVPGIGTRASSGPRFDPTGRLIVPPPIVSRLFRKL